MGPIRLSRKRKNEKGGMGQGYSVQQRTPAEHIMVTKQLIDQITLFGNQEIAQELVESDPFNITFLKGEYFEKNPRFYDDMIELALRTDFSSIIFLPYEKMRKYLRYPNHRTTRRFGSIIKDYTRIKYGTLRLHRFPRLMKIKYIPKTIGDITSEEDRIKFLKDGGYWLRIFIPSEITPEIAETAIRACGYAIFDVPLELQTRFFLSTAITRDPDVLDHIYLFEQQQDHPSIRSVLPKELLDLIFKKDLSFLTELLLGNIDVFEHIQNPSPEIVKTAVMQKGSLLCRCESEFKDDFLFVGFAVKNDGYAFRCASERLRNDPETVKQMIGIHVNAVYSSLENSTLDFNLKVDLCRIALSKNPYVFLEGNSATRQSRSHLSRRDVEIPLLSKCSVVHDTFDGRDLLIEELLIIALGQDGLALRYIPPSHRTSEMLMIAVREDGRALQYIDATIQTVELCQTAIEHDDRIGTAMGFVREDLRERLVIPPRFQDDDEEEEEEEEEEGS